jgi:probable F420-dependent oxidoreductase
MKLGIALARAHWSTWSDLSQVGEALGYESVWISEHLAFPTQMSGSPIEGSEHPPVPPQTPVFDVSGALCFLAARTTSIRLGTYVSLLGIRHPFVAARSFATADVWSAGRVEVGVGAGWLREEWIAAGLDPATRGLRLDESIEVCRRLWTEPTVEHHGRFWDFDEVAFEPKPFQKPLPLLVGGESDAALRRAARLGDGWIGMGADIDRAAGFIDKLRRYEEQVDRPDTRCTITIGGPAALDPATVERYAALGVDRLIVSPWESSRGAIAGLEALAASLDLTP